MSTTYAEEAVTGPPEHLAPVQDEQAVLGSALLSARSLDELMPSVPSGAVFYVPRHGAVWEAIAAQWERGETPVDAVTTAAELSRMGELERSGGPAYLHTLIATVPTAANGVYYLRRVLAAWKLRAGDSAMTRGHQVIRSPDGGDPDLILAAVAAEVEAARDLGLREDGAVRVGDVVQPLIDSLDAPPWDDDAPGVPWPYHDLGGVPGSRTPGLLNPMRGGELWCIAGRPGHGKSTMIADCLQHVSFDMGQPSLLVSYEMSREQITARIVSRQARVLLSHLTRPGMLDDNDRARIADFLPALHAAPLIIVDKKDTSLAEVDRLIRRHQPRLVAIDYLQLAVPDGPDEMRRARVERYTRALKILAGRRDVPIITGSQLNRASELRRDHVPRMADLRETGGIEQDCDGVILLHRPDLNEPESPRAGEVDAIVAKQRNGPTDTVPLAALLHYARFADMAR